MNVKRFKHELVLLDDGRVLAIGGENEPSCEIYDTSTEKWTLTDSLLLYRKDQPKAVKLQNGNILITGGHRSIGVGKEEIYKSCEIFDVQSEKWIKVADMHYTRKWHTITALGNGNILVTGGIGQRYSLDTMTKICEIYDVSSNTWVMGDTLKVSRFNHDALQLNDDKIFISAGEIKGENYYYYTEVCEIYDPEIDKWYYAGVLTMYHPRHSSFQLNDSLILIVGGDNENWEIFNLNEQESTYIGYSDIVWSLQSIVKLSNNDIVKIGGVIWQDAVVFPTNKCKIFHFNITSIKNKKTGQISNYELFQNYPNPFNPSTTIQYDLPEDVKVVLEVFDIQGQKVKTLVNGFKKTGYYEVIFDGSHLASGVYIYKIKAGDFSQAKRMLLIK